MDDGPSTRDEGAQSTPSRASLAAVWFDGLRVDKIRLDAVQVDALDVTDVILHLLSKTRTHVVFLSGVSFAGFNIVDSKRLHSVLDVPIIVISREKPDNASVKRALRKHFEDWKRRWRLVRGLGRIYAFAPKPSDQPLHFEAVGVSPAKARRIIRAYCVTSRVPEPIRVAGIVAKGLAIVGNELSGCRHEVRNG